jgi:septum formation protein
VILASASPRRQQLLKNLIPEFMVFPADLDEDALTTADPFETARSLALAKALHVAQLHPGSLVIGGDTVVAIPTHNGFQQLAKPLNPAHAVEMLQTLAGKRHVVTTGIAVVYPEGAESSHGETWVTFRELAEAEIFDYVAGGEPLDKAGSYGIQGAARAFITQIDGPEDNVIGLPTDQLRALLTAAADRLGFAPVSFG